MPRVSLSIFLLGLAGCSTVGASTEYKMERDYFNTRDCQFYGQSFCTMAPGEGVYISIGPDFLVYNFHYDERTVVTVFEGNHAMKFGSAELSDYSPRQVGSVTVRYREFDDGETFHRYFVNDKIDRPATLHFMSPNDLTLAQNKFVEYLMETLRYCRPEGASMICG